MSDKKSVVTRVDRWSQKDDHEFAYFENEKVMLDQYSSHCSIEKWPSNHLDPHSVLEYHHSTRQHKQHLPTHYVSSLSYQRQTKRKDSTGAHVTN